MCVAEVQDRTAEARVRTPAGCSKQPKVSLHKLALVQPGRRSHTNPLSRRVPASNQAQTDRTRDSDLSRESLEQW